MASWTCSRRRSRRCRTRSRKCSRRTDMSNGSNGSNAASGSPRARLRVYRGDKELGELRDYEVETYTGMVVLDAIHEIQAREAPDLAVRWNCKAGRCGS